MTFAWTDEPAERKWTPRSYVKRIVNRANLTSQPVKDATAYVEITLSYVSILGEVE